ncbi:MAG: Rieske 2Fe-2S domain-containing protein [Candidatus Dormiibacterota bacterium]
MAGHRGTAAKSFLNGTWLGHPLHPALTDVPIGTWVAAALLDQVDPGNGDSRGLAADLLWGAGSVGGVAAAVSGLADWEDKFGAERDLATAHGLLNSAALLLIATSLVVRHRGSRRAGVRLSLVGLGLVGAGAYVGGDLVFRLGIQVNRNAFTEGPIRWQAVTAEKEIHQGTLLTKMVGDCRIVLTRFGGEVCAASAVCSHAGGPLDELPLEEGQLHCPWHGSRFDLRSGRVTTGPAVVANPVFETRTREGMVEVRVHPA